MQEQKEILIVGAGIGGLAAALSLHEAGFEVRVFEAVPEIRPLGVGLNMLPHAVRELDELGLREDVEAAGVACRELAYYTKRGERIWAEPRGLTAGYRWPQISIHRGTLQMILLEAVRQRIGADHLHMDHALGGFDAMPGHGVKARFVERSSGKMRPVVEGRLLIACDGIHSAARRVFFPRKARRAGMRPSCGAAWRNPPPCWTATP